MACNTSCATALELGWPDSDAPILDLIESAAIAVKQARYRNVGVIATAATARSGAYALTIGEHAPGTHVTEIAAPALVPLVEAGKLEDAETRAEVAAACEQLPRGVDAVVLACTHYPLLEAHFRSALGSGVAIIDPAQMHAQRAVKLVADLGIAPGAGATLCMTSGNLHRFRENVETLIGDLKPEITDSPGSVGVGATTELAREGAGG
jgi:glutamate racemase